MTGNSKAGRLSRPQDRGKAVRSLLTGKETQLDQNLDAFYLPLDKLVANPDQPRQTYNSEKEDELKASIAEQGILQPLVVRPIEDGYYQIVAGERRYRAAVALELEKVPVIVKELNDTQVPLVSLTENLQRADLDEVDEQRFFQTLINDYNYSATDIARLINKSAGYVKNRLYGNLQSLQTTQTSSEISHNQSSQDGLIQKSQSHPKKALRHPAFRPNNTFKLINRRLDEAVDYLSNAPTPDQKTQEQLKEGLAQLKAKISELEKALQVKK